MKQNKNETYKNLHETRRRPDECELKAEGPCGRVETPGQDDNREEHASGRGVGEWAGQLSGRGIRVGRAWAEEHSWLRKCELMSVNYEL